MFQGYTDYRENSAYKPSVPNVFSLDYGNYNPENARQKEGTKESSLEVLIQRCDEAVEELDKRITAAA